MDKANILDFLQSGRMQVQGQFTWGSNYTFLVSLTHKRRKMKAVYKPLKGEMPLWDFQPESLAGREVAAFLLSEALGWELVPPTVIREEGPFGRGSVQFFIAHDPELTYFSMDAATRERLKPAAVFDLLLNNADRKGSHILLDGSGHIWMIDHGLCFHAEPKLRTVMWEFSRQEIPDDLMHDVEQLVKLLDHDDALRNNLGKYLSVQEMNALQARAEALLRHAHFPEPDPNRRPYPWPLV